MAWLHATPEKQNKPRGAILAEQGSGLVNLPEAGEQAFLVECLMEAGPLKLGADGGASPIGHVEILAWAQATGTHLTQWVANTLKLLSETYVVQLRKSRDVRCPPPVYTDNRPIEERRAAVAAKFKARTAKGKKRGN